MSKAKLIYPTQGSKSGRSNLNDACIIGGGLRPAQALVRLASSGVGVRGPPEADPYTGFAPKPSNSGYVGTPLVGVRPKYYTG